MRRSGLILIAAVACACVELCAAPAFAGFGAIAYNPDSGNRGFAWNYETQQKADEIALRDCGAGCKIVFRVRPGLCGALASAEKSEIWGGATRPSVDAARLAALENCQKRTGAQCILRGSECNRREEGAPPARR